MIIAGLLLGASATVRQLGEILVLPALLYLLIAGGGWRTVLTRAAALAVAFVLPIAAYMTGSHLITGHFWLASSTPSLASYGRMATAADCATLRIPAYERPLCPTPRQRAYGIDWLDHDVASPLRLHRSGRDEPVRRHRQLRPPGAGSLATQRVLAIAADGSGCSC